MIASNLLQEVEILVSRFADLSLPQPTVSYNDHEEAVLRWKSQNGRLALTVGLMGDGRIDYTYLRKGIYIPGESQSWGIFDPYFPVDFLDYLREIVGRKRHS